MYLFEWGFQWSKNNCSYEEQIKQHEPKKKPGQAEINPPENVQESVSLNTQDNNSLYAYNPIYIDIRTPNDEKRGLITFFVGGNGALLIWGYGLAWSQIFGTLINQHIEYPDGLTIGFFLFLATVLCCTVVASYVYFKYAFPYLRLESFTSRRLIVRFNRITRKVYLLRPKYLGGTRIMCWDKTEILLDKGMSELDGTGGFLILVWDKGDGEDIQGRPTDNIELTFVGRPTRNASELLAFWEYIRRYMEDGPAAAPPPEKLLSKFPWPWLSLKAAWGLDTSFLRNSGLRIFVLINLMLLPVILIHAFGHWISLLLCYEPRFPKAIEDAGRGSTQ